MPKNLNISLKIFMEIPLDNTYFLVTLAWAIISEGLGLNKKSKYNGVLHTIIHLLAQAIVEDAAQEQEATQTICGASREHTHASPIQLPNRIIQKTKRNSKKSGTESTESSEEDEHQNKK